MTTVVVFGILAGAFAGFALGFLLAAVLAGAKEEDAFRAGYCAGLMESEPFDEVTKKIRDLAEIERSYGGSEE